MTLEEKMKEMGYEESGIFEERFEKELKDLDLWLSISIKEDEINYYVGAYDFFSRQRQIDNLQIAFNNLKRDLKEIEKWLKEKTNA